MIFTPSNPPSSETLSGVTTVRAMAAVPRFVRENEELVEASLRTTYSGQVFEMGMVMMKGKSFSETNKAFVFLQKPMRLFY